MELITQLYAKLVEKTTWLNFPSLDCVMSCCSDDGRIERQNDFHDFHDFCLIVYPTNQLNLESKRSKQSKTFRLVGLNHLEPACWKTKRQEIVFLSMHVNPFLKL
jgi:hypothetical protein